MSNTTPEATRVNRRAFLATCSASSAAALTLLAGQAEAQQTPLDAGSPRQAEPLQV